jgi:YnbE-like lipoprotein
MSTRPLRPARLPAALCPCTSGRRRSRALPALLAVGLGLSASCTPKIQVEPPKDPITINLNIKLDADIRLKVEEVAKEDVRTKPIF